MKKWIAPAALAMACAVAPAAFAAADLDLARSKNCMACHSIGNKVVGPAFKDVARRYAGQPDIDKKLAEKIMKGGSGAWGVVSMPANPQVSPAEAQALAQWILTLK
ncbi:cytochrome C' [Oxalobacteraceae bacterium CAVE-383]|nr:cytochrome C' [Oxalobacteraceae bacterium CAVE-383]